MPFAWFPNGRSHLWISAANSGTMATKDANFTASGFTDSHVVTHEDTLRAHWGAEFKAELQASPILIYIAMSNKKGLQHKIRICF